MPEVCRRCIHFLGSFPPWAPALVANITPPPPGAPTDPRAVYCVSVRTSNATCAGSRVNDLSPGPREAHDSIATMPYKEKTAPHDTVTAAATNKSKEAKTTTVAATTLLI